MCCFGRNLLFAAHFGILPWLATPVSAQNLVAPQPALRLDFDQGVDGVGRDGQKIAAQVEGTTDLVDCKFGKAFKSGPGAGYLHFPVQGIVSPQAGTVEMWVCPVDWNGDEQKFHVFFDARGQGELYLYKYFSGGLVMLSGDQLSGPYATVNAPIKAWQPGEWHFIAATWSGRHQALYIDGQLAGNTESDLPPSLTGEFTLGDNPWNEPGLDRTSSSLIARVRVYDRELSPQHIAAHFAGNYDATVPLSAATAQLSYSVAPLAETLTARVDASEADSDLAAAHVDFSITQAGKPIKSRVGQPFEEAVAKANFSSELPPGAYQVQAVVTCGAQSFELDQPLTVPAHPWLNNTLGEARKVLPPWTPIQIVDDGTGAFTVKCWGRDYQFSRAPLPVQIVSQGEPLLQSPVQLRVWAGGHELAWSSANVRILRSDDYAVDITGAAIATVPEGPVSLFTTLHIEYDGLALLTVNLGAPANFQPDGVILDLPMRPEVAWYRHRWSSGGAGLSGNLPDGTGIVDASDFIPYSWLGDNQRGLFWFCESAQNWPNWRDPNAYQTVREGGSVVMRLILLHGQQMPANWTFTCGLQATPVKPLPPDWRKWRLDPANGANVKIEWPATDRTNKYFGYPEAADPAAFQARVAAVHQQGEAVVPYSCLTYLSAGSPEWNWYGSEWGMGGGNSDIDGVAAYSAAFKTVNPREKSLQDFLVWKNLEFQQRYGLDGFYHDDTAPIGSVASGLGWKDGDQRQPTYPILAYRELYRRVYAVAKTQNPNAFLMSQMSGKVAIPILAYGDADLDGENFRGAVKDSYMDVMGLDAWRAEFRGKQWGVVPFFLPEFDEANRDLVQPTRGLAALALLHDVSVWPMNSNLAEWNKLYDALDAFGYVDSTFVPYFDKAPPATTDMPDVYASVYRRADGRALAVVGNTSRDPRSGTVTFDGDRLGLPSANVITWPDRQPVGQTGTKFQMNIPGLDYRLLLIGKPPATSQP